MPDAHALSLKLLKKSTLQQAMKFKEPLNLVSQRLLFQAGEECA